MKYQTKIEKTISESIEAKSRLLDSGYLAEIERIGSILAEIIREGGKIMFCGNGGSAADSQHLAAELVVRLRSSFDRPSIPAIALTVDTSILTACGNDYGFDYIFARQIESLASHKDALIAISTSGNSPNVIKAVESAKKIGTKVIGLLGGDGGKMAEMCDISFISPSEVTARIQEIHILTGHIWCEIIEEELFG